MREENLEGWTCEAPSKLMRQKELLQLWVTYAMSSYAQVFVSDPSVWYEHITV